MNEPNPILIVGISRSGTTMLDRMINANPKVKIFYVRTALLRRLTGIYDPLDEKNLLRLLKATKKMFDVYGVKIMSDKKISSIKDYVLGRGLNYKNIYLGLVKELLNPSEGERWGEKYDGYGGEIKHFMNFFPEGQVILITRNLFDSYSSAKKAAIRREEENIPAGPQFGAGKFSSDEYLLILDDWKRLALNWNKFTNKYPKKSHLHVNFEDLIQQPDKTAKKICDFLRLEYSEDMINPQKLVDWKGDPWQVNTSFKQNISGFDKSNIGKHRHSLSKEETSLIESYALTYSINKEESSFTIKNLYSDTQSNKENEKSLYRWTRIFRKISTSKSEPKTLEQRLTAVIERRKKARSY